MQQIASQLKAVRRTGRMLLVLRRVAQWLSVLLPLLIALGLLDYALRLPGLLRLMIGLVLLGAAGVWLVTRLGRAIKFWPSLAELALRAERLYPQLAGSLASAVEFSIQPGGYNETASTAQMTRLAIDEMQDKSRGIDVKRMINPGPTLRACALAALSACILGAVIAATPNASATAASRWFMPLGDTQWPKVNQVEPLTDDSAVFPADGKLRLRAKVTRGWYEDLRMTIQYRVPDEEGNGDWQSVRVASQRPQEATGEHIYETVLDVPPAVARSLMSGQRTSATLEVRYSAGDDTTQTQRLTLAARPEIESVVVTTTPPAYALGILGEQRTPLHEQSDRIASTSAYLGSTATLTVQFNKPIPNDKALATSNQWLLLVGDDAALDLDSSDDLAEGFKLTWVIRETITGSFALTDGFGLSSNSTDRQYRIKAVQDELPSVLLIDPAIDESLLPGATANLKAQAEDDVAMQSLRLEVVVPDRANTPEDAVQIATRQLQDPKLLKTGRFESLETDYTLSLAPLELLPGDEVLITAVGGDIFELDDQRHELVRSDTRRLRIITERELADQVRRVLRGVRNSAQSLERNQRIVAKRTNDGQPAENAEQQGDLTRRIAAQQETIDAVQERLDRNAPQELGVLQDLLERTEGMLNKAKEASEQAEQALDNAAAQQEAGEQARQQGEAAEQAGDKKQAEQNKQDANKAKAEQDKAQAKAAKAQEKTREQLAELIAALDMGESVGEIESELAGIKSDAERVARKTKELLPKTIGKKAEDLDEQERQELKENADKQRELAERAEELIKKMRATADEIGENGQTPEQRATSKTLSEAADIAERQGLEESIEQAGEQLEENQIADAASKQQQAMATLEQMLQEMGKQQERRQEELKRLLQELAQKIQKLAAEQKEQLARAEQTDGGALGVLEQPQFSLRRRTMLVEAQAMEAPDTAEVGNVLGQAVSDQAEAVKAIRIADKEATLLSEADALAHLEEALKLLNEKKQQEQEEQVRQERFALRQAYYDLAERQEKLSTILTQHERDEDYSRRDWRQINRLYKEPLEDRTFDEEQDAIKAVAQELSEKAGEAMVYQSLHRRIDKAAGRAQTRLSGRLVDGMVIEDQQAVAKMLRAMGDALDDTADPDKFKKDQQDQDGNQGEGEGQGEGEEPPLVPDLSQIKLLREIMIVLRNETQIVAEAGDELKTEVREQRLTELAEEQRELKALGEQLIEKLKQQMQAPEIEPRN